MGTGNAKLEDALKTQPQQMVFETSEDHSRNLRSCDDQLKILQENIGRIKRGIKDSKSPGEREHLESAYKAGLNVIIDLEASCSERMVKYIEALTLEGVIVNDGDEKLEAKDFFRCESAGFKLELEDAFPVENPRIAIKNAEANFSKFLSVKNASPSIGDSSKGALEGAEGVGKNPQPRIGPGADKGEVVGDEVDKDGEKCFDADAE